MSTLKINTLSNVAGTQSTAVENAIQGSAKAWVNFNGTGTVAIRASYNVSSITDVGGTGVFRINFSTPMSDTNYCVVRSVDYNSVQDGNVISVSEITVTTVNSFDMTTQNSAGSYYDPVRVECAIFR